MSREVRVRVVPRVDADRMPARIDLVCKEKVMREVAIMLDDATEAALNHVARTAGIPLHNWLQDLILRHASAACDPAVLVVDDDPVCREMLRCLVEGLGWHIDTAANGAEALALLSERRYRLLLTDCRMPVMDGYQLAHAIRSRERRLGCPPLLIVAVTSESMMADRAFCHGLGFDSCLPKPPVEETLAPILARWLGPAPSLANRDMPRQPARRSDRAFAQASGERDEVLDPPLSAHPE